VPGHLFLFSVLSGWLKQYIISYIYDTQNTNYNKQKGFC